MRARFVGATLMAASFAMATAITVSAQTPSPSQPPSQPGAPPTAQPPRPTTPPPAQAKPATDQAITITGCLKEEKDVPGRKPNVAEKAGVSEDYILTDVKAAAGSNVSALGLGTMYEIEGVDNSELKKHVNHQIEVAGKIRASVTGGVSTDNGLPQFTATSIKMLAATCPAAK